MDVFKTIEVIEVMEHFLLRKRPPENIRHEVDIGYKIERQSVILYEIRSQWDKPEVILERPFAKTTLVKVSNNWKIFWMRGDLKWHVYSPMPEVKTLKEFIKVVEEDEYHCFFG